MAGCRRWRNARGRLGHALALGLSAAVLLAAAGDAAAQHGAEPGGGAGMPAVPYADLIAEAADRYALDPLLLTALVRQESNFRPRARSRAGAVGLTQLMPRTARGLGLVVDRRRRIDERVVPELALDGGARYLREQLDRFERVRLALAAYNAGPRAVRRYRGIPPYRETRTYVRRVFEHLAEYREATLEFGAEPASG